MRVSSSDSVSSYTKTFINGLSEIEGQTNTLGNATLEERLAFARRRIPKFLARMDAVMNTIG